MSPNTIPSAARLMAGRAALVGTCDGVAWLACDMRIPQLPMLRRDRRHYRSEEISTRHDLKYSRTLAFPGPRRGLLPGSGGADDRPMTSKTPETNQAEKWLRPVNVKKNPRPKGRRCVKSY